MNVLADADPVIKIAFSSEPNGSAVSFPLHSGSLHDGKRFPDDEGAGRDFFLCCCRIG
jgi:hypothetical protein